MNVLVIGGSDPSAASGVQGDIKTLSRLGVYSPCVITSITAQNTTQYNTTKPLDSKIITKQFDSVLSDFKIDGIKIGMVYNSRIIKIIHSKIKHLDVPIVLDPVIKSTTGGILLEKNSIDDFKKYLIPNSLCVTPNTFEAKIISNHKIKTRQDVIQAAKSIQNLGIKYVIITGNEFKPNKITDVLVTQQHQYLFDLKKISGENRGSGCGFSSAIISQLVHGHDILHAIKFAQKFTNISIKNSVSYGSNLKIVESMNDDHFNKLKFSIEQFTKLKNISKIIPECQTNFVFAKEKPKSISDILGVDGRIVKTRGSSIMAGTLEYGGSKHVSTAVLTMMKRFPNVRSAVNIKYDKLIIKCAKKLKMRITSYDRTLESKSQKKEGISIKFGISNAIMNSQIPPELIFHTGDHGKEPMILVFGQEPLDVLNKITSILELRFD